VTAGRRDPDIAAVTALVEHVAYEVVLPRFGTLRQGEVADKGVGDPVTVVDKAAEAALTAGLHALAPGVPVVGEEATAADPDLLGTLRDVPRVFLVDPIDGTKAFIGGTPEFAVMVGYVVEGVPVAGWICMPVLRHTWVAERGAGAFRDGAPLPAVERPAVPRVRVASSGGREGGVAQRAAARGLDVEAGRPAYSGATYTSLVDGGLDAAVHWAGWPWDHAAGAAILHEAGGTVGTLDGAEYRVVGRRGPLVVASSRATFDLVRELVAERA